jgi:hypothetical protein
VYRPGKHCKDYLSVVDCRGRDCESVCRVPRVLVEASVCSQSAWSDCRGHENNLEVRTGPQFINSVSAKTSPKNARFRENWVCKCEHSLGNCRESAFRGFKDDVFFIGDEILPNLRTERRKQADEKGIDFIFYNVVSF